MMARISPQKMPQRVSSGIKAMLLLAALSSGPARADVPANPIQVTVCQAAPNPVDSSRPIAAISFVNNGTQAVTAVKFGIFLMDTFGERLGSPTIGTVYGSFSPGVTIDPHKTPIGYYRQNDADPGSAAFPFYNLYGNQAVNILCQPLAAKFADGTAWLPQQQM